MIRKFQFFTIKRSLIYGIVLLLLANMGVACLDEIDIATPRAEKLLTVSGNINTSPGPYTVNLARSTTFSSEEIGERVPEPVSGAIVKIMDDRGQEEILEEKNTGTYQTQADGIRGEPGRTYTLEISLDGNTYRSQPETILPVVSAESVEVDFLVEEVLNDVGNLTEREVVKAYVNTPFPPGERSFLKWNTFGIYEYLETAGQGNLNPNICYVTETIDLDNIVVADSDTQLDGFLNRQEVITKLVDFRFTRNYCFTIIQQSISRPVYEFWAAAQSEFERTGDIFEPPPGKIPGNVMNVADDQEEVLGIFYASAVDTIRHLVNSSEVGNPRPQCRPFPRGPDSCFDCLILPRSTYDVPECWK